MTNQLVRNVAIIAHVDHGKTTLVDQLFKHSGMYRSNQVVEERLMDSMDLERERGITISSKNGAFRYKGHHINVIDTPGHADFGGQVERVLQMADGALLVVDAQEGPMPQTFFVLKKALALKLPIIVVVNKIDKPAARPDWVINQVFDLFVSLDAPDHILDFHIVYASAKNGFATLDPAVPSNTLVPLLDSIIDKIPAPDFDETGPSQLLISSISYSPFLGRLGIGKVTSGRLAINQLVKVSGLTGTLRSGRITKLYGFEKNEQIPITSATAGDIVCVAGIEDLTVGETITDPDTPIPLPAVQIDPPTISMTFQPNDSPFSGKSGEFVTGRHLKERLHRETLSDVALHVQDIDGGGFVVSGRGELHLSILIEKMRREGYEFQVTRPRVITKKDENGVLLEPFEELTLEVSETLMGGVMELVGERKAQMINMENDNGLVTLVYKIPTRGLLGFKSDFLTATKGMGVMNYIFSEFAPFAGSIPNRKNGVLVSMVTGQTLAYALFNLQERGRLFLGPGANVYEGQIVGENAREDDLVVNPCKGKKLTNMRASGSDDSVILTPPTRLSLEQCLAYINDDELVEITPDEIRLRKIYLTETARKTAKK